MTAFDRNAALEQQQIQEISDNVTRRLLKALDRCRTVPPALAAEVGAQARTVSDIQREIDHLMAAWPPHDPLDIAVLTHVLASQQHALGILEELETRLQTTPAAIAQPAPDHTHAHQTLIAVARSIEAEAMRHAAPVPAAPPHYQDHYHHQAPPAWVPPAGPAAGPGYAPPPPAAPLPVTTPWPAPHPAHPAAPPAPARQQTRTHATQHPPQRANPPAAAARPPQAASSARSILTALRARLGGPSTVATLTALTVAAVLITGVLSLMPPPDPNRTTKTSRTPDQKLDGRLGANGENAPQAAGEAATTFPMLGLANPAATGAMEQPYLVVLATRRTTDELQRDYQSFKQAYPDLLGTSRTRVDRLQGQDRQTWYRLSLIPPQAHADAKALCRNLKAAGLTGCWIKQVPLN